MSTNTKSWRAVMAAASFMVLGVAGSARADIIIDLAPPFPTVTDENILFEEPGVTIDDGLTVTGITNTSDELFSFTENSESLSSVAGGQARVEGTREDSKVADPFDYLLIDAVDPTTYFTGFEANINLAADTQVKITVTEDNGTQQTALLSGGDTGNNFFTIYAISNQLIDNVLIETLSGQFIIDVAQVRVGGVQGENVPEVIPEPASLLLFGTGLAGLGGAVRRRMKARKTA